ncbi:hypothetical protein [Novosphingobium sp. KN65.2]|uniref:hypothetical protein n=1 Tax=Novosphingobium sp. KN65.2 TaxID=1478134 RepID=UPI0005DF19A0|nr:hypothetical protein [Novosphingobium sp. KN65.2]CDO35801.1 hypothetical protein SPHV1_2270147 [Novosphingobium sp. KN65.2]
MRTEKQTRTKGPTIKPFATPFTFQCTACGAVEHRRTPALPEGWATEQIGDDIYAYCPDDAIDLPQESVQ